MNTFVFLITKYSFCPGILLEIDVSSSIFDILLKELKLIANALHTTNILQISLLFNFFEEMTHSTLLNL